MKQDSLCAKNSLIENIRQALIGEGVLIRTPFGLRPLIYADYTASGRSLHCIESYIQKNVLPYYANTHSESSATGRQSTRLREQARQLIKNAVNAGEQHALIFCGHGATAAIHKFIDILNLRLPAELNERYQFDRQIPDEQRPVVFIGPYEHHSNELPWRESIAELVTIPLTEKGSIDGAYLQSMLQCFADRPLKIGSFSAASNVTGIKSDVDGISQLLHRYNALACWDYAAAAPYVAINMSGASSVESDAEGDCSKDAIFISSHKLIGGPGTPGILLINKSLLSNTIPAVPGGGTVSYVTMKNHRYLPDGERREEGGTPDIVGSIRAGLAFQLKDIVGSAEIERRENDFIKRAFQHWRRNPAIDLLGNVEAERISIVSLQIIKQGKPLHYGFVVALLSDLFGIQARGGCSCAGPYGHTLLGIDSDYSRALEEQVQKGHSILRPGWVRFNFNYFISEDTFQYLLRAIDWIAEQGWMMFPNYRYDNGTGIWCYGGKVPSVGLDLTHIDYTDVTGFGNRVTDESLYCTEVNSSAGSSVGSSVENSAVNSPDMSGSDSLLRYIDYAGAIAAHRFSVTEQIEAVPTLPYEVEQLRWFYYPKCN